MTGLKYNLIVSRAMFWFLKTDQALDSCACRWYLLRTENALFILFWRRKWKNGHNIGTAVPEKDSIYPLFILAFFFISIPNVNWFFPQFINEMATNNDLLMDELHVSYFAQKLWLYVMIWLPRTTDNSTYFAQSL